MTFLKLSSLSGLVSEGSVEKQHQQDTRRYRFIVRAGSSWLCRQRSLGICSLQAETQAQWWDSVQVPRSPVGLGMGLERGQ